VDDFHRGSAIGPHGLWLFSRDLLGPGGNPGSRIVLDPAGEQSPRMTLPDERAVSRYRSFLRADWDRQDDAIPATLEAELATRNGER
jgi:hypothetical protein